ncbi:phosphoribosyl-AMP cyclohydrolase [Hwanghaeella sp. LZ110]|jgi:phosphoribosyl-AMP cyclohydrolase|uniref:phosphoribosyl-AMP cyclohydrolase n=1 Tax=Hwanghaeella sp. LZ110 TaxID=3402810 RepID=UPI003B679432
MPFPDPASLSKAELETGSRLAPKFDANGLIVVMTVHADTGEALMVAYMNAEALERTLATGEAHYWSRSRQELWHKGATSGQVQKLVELRVDCDQDAILLRVMPQGDGGCCHVGYRSCFYRNASTDGTLTTIDTKL